MRCPRCGNTDEKWFYKGSKGYYCRKCIRFKRVLLEEDEEEVTGEQYHNEPENSLRFELSKRQKEISGEILKTVNQGENVLVWAVCGAGKTELVYETIKQYLLKGKKVCFAISRRQVVIQLAERIRKDFPNLKVVAVCGGMTRDLFGDLVICTTHQLYRYRKYFDLLILDEPDGFPFKGDEVLQGIALSSVKGPIIFLTATPDKWIMSQADIILTLNQRPSDRGVPVPKEIVLLSPLLFICLFILLYKQKKKGRKTMVFFPEIKMMNLYGKLYKHIFKIECLCSKTENKDEIIGIFMERKVDFLFCTTVMERGVTFPDIDVIVYRAEHMVFDKSSLIQISGRVSRDIRYPEGTVWFLAKEKGKEIKECITYSLNVNATASGAGKI